MRRKLFMYILLMLSFITYVQFQQKDETLQDLYKTKGMSQIASNFYDNGWIDFKRELKINPKDIFEKYKNLFGLGMEDEMKLIRVISDKDNGTDHYTYQQYYRNIRIEGMSYSIHSNQDGVYSANGQIAPSLDIDPTPKILIKEAKSLTLQNQIVSGLRGIFFRDSTEVKDSLIIIKNPNITTIDNKKYILAYSFKFVDTLKHDVFKIQLDANTGNILSVKSTSSNVTLVKPDRPGTCTTWYNGNKVVNTYFHNANWPCPDFYYMGPRAISAAGVYMIAANFTEIPCKQPSPGYLWSSQNIWTTTDVRTHVSAFWAIQKSENFFTNLGTAYINNFTNLIYVDSPFAYPNAAYNYDLHTFTFGAPVANKCNHMVELDIVGHEYGHGVIGYYYGNSLSDAGETGALKEGLCDAFGAMIEASQGYNESTTYTMGYNSIYDNAYKRSLKSPKLLGTHTIDEFCQTASGQPDTYLGQYWDYRGCDLAGIHTNSTVISHWFYLLAEGGDATNDVGFHYHVNGIGRDKATRIIYKYVKNQWMGLGASFTDARIGTTKAAIEEYGLCSNEYYQVMNAWNAVNVSSTYLGIDYVKIINPPSTVCYPSGSLFSINCIPCTGTITWHKSDNLAYIGGNTGNSVTVRPVTSLTSGEGWLFATIVTSCGTLDLSAVTFWVGPPVVTVTGDASSACTNTTHYFTATATNSRANASNFTWNLVPLNGNYVSPYGPQNSLCAITFYNPYSASGYTVQSRAQNSCGTGGYSSTNIYIHTCFTFLLSPNPASETVTVTKQISGASDIESSAALTEDATTIYTISIINYYGSLQYTTTRSGDNFTLPVNTLKDGQYIVQFNNGKDIFNSRLIVKH